MVWDRKIPDDVGEIESASGSLFQGLNVSRTYEEIEAHCR